MGVSIGDLLSSQAQNYGYKYLKDYINKDAKFGIFTKDGKPFYEGIIPYDNKIRLFGNDVSIGDGKTEHSIKIFGKDFKLGGNNLVEAGVFSINYTQAFFITNSPVENGGFISVNQVKNPLQGQVKYVTTGTVQQRKYFEKALMAAESSLTLFHLLTEEIDIPDVKIISHTVSRGADTGRQLIEYLITVQEVRTKAQVTALQNATPYSGQSTDGGNIQPGTASGNQQQAAAKKQ